MSAPPRLGSRRLNPVQMLLVAGLVAVISATPLLTYLEYTGLTSTVDSFGIAQNVTGNLADAQRDALLTQLALAGDGTSWDPQGVRAQADYLGQQLRILASKDVDAATGERVAAAVAAHAELVDLLDSLGTDPDVAAQAAALPRMSAAAATVSRSLSGLYAQFENSFYRDLSAELRLRRDRQALIMASAVLAMLLGIGLAESLRRTVRRDFESAYRLLAAEAADRAQAERDAARTEARFAALVEGSAEAILLLDREQRIVYANPPSTGLLGRPSAGLAGAPLVSVLSPASRVTTERAFAEVVGRPGASLTLDVELADRPSWAPGDGAAVLAVRLTNRLDDPSVAGVVVNAHDVTERARHADELEHLAYHDRLTGLPNRLAMEGELARLAGSTRAATVAVLDLDGFGRLNERWGDDAGDLVLRTVAARLRSADPTMAAYHLGGDEFALLGTPAAGATGPLADRVRAAVCSPVRCGDAWIELTCGLGIASARLDGLRGPTLLRHADAAMHEAKRLGPDQVVVMDEARARAALELSRLTEQLAGAAERGELELAYQPIVRAGDRAWVSVEALLRWRHGGAVVAPAAFVPAAEASGLILPIGRWVLRRALADLAALRVRTGLPLRVNVNVAASQLADPGFLGDVLDALRDASLPPQALVVELTETAVLEDPVTATTVLTAVRDAGVEIALDDFGTGYSSLSYLLRLPVASVKLDRSFVADVATSTRTRRLLAALVAIAHDMGLTVTVEGVETDEAMGAVAAAGTDTVQGYLIARPVPLDEVAHSMA